MRVIKNMVCLIKEEIHDAEKYYIEILKTEDRKEKEVFSTIGLQELEHAMKLHDLVVTLIKEKQAQGVSVPAGMQEIWNMEHVEIVENVSDLKSKLTKY